MKVDVLLIHPPVNMFLKKRPIQHSLCIGYGLLHIAASLIKNGYKVVVWNLENVRTLYDISYNDIEKSLKEFDPLIIGIELNWVSFSKGAIQIAEFIKNIRPDIPIIIGGTHATIFSYDIVRNYDNIIDAVLKGEAEITFPKVIDKFEKSGNIEDVGGLLKYKNGYIQETPITKDDICINIDDIPPYSYKVVNPITLDSVRLNLGPSINTCRGPCIYNCIYCIGGQINHFSGRSKFSVHSSDWIINQINTLIDEGAKEFLFQDDLFLCGKKRLMKIANELRKEKINEKILGINMTAVPGILDGETLEELSKAGVYNIDYGVESGSDQILNILKRPVFKNNLLDTIKTTISKGIIPFTWWMTGLPKERSNNIYETLNLINKTIELGSVPRWITPLVILPGTILFEQAYKYGVTLKMKSFKDYSIYSDLYEKAVTWYPEAISHETEYLNRFDIIQETINLKFNVFEKRELIIDNFMKNIDILLSYHPSLSYKIIENWIGNIVGNILKSFF